MSVENEEVVALPRRKLSCTTHFDALWFCYSPVHQMQQYYRLGSLDNCAGKWDALVDCLKLKTKRSHEVQMPLLWEVIEVLEPGIFESDETNKMEVQGILESREKDKSHIWCFRTPEEAASHWNDMYGHLDNHK